MKNEPPKTIFRKDYQPPDYWVERIDLDFDLGEEITRVRSRLAVRRNDALESGTRPLVLDGEGLKLAAVRLDGAPLSENAYTIDDRSLTVHTPPERFTLETEALIQPQENTALEGLYKSGGSFCTQCEAEGFRRITWYPDRPDVMAVFNTRITADRNRYPMLLSNGNLMQQGVLDGNRHYAVWHDPFSKPCYLFALVAGKLAFVEDTFITKSGRRVVLRIYVEPGKQSRCDYAMACLKKAMRWDEEVFGLEYDLDIFMIVAVSDFNMGAMENKGLNVFNDKYILADPETATDVDYAHIEAIIAHEYFHNWTGNRVTCRDWFQLSLKEGLTVFRDQMFSADMRSPAVERIQQVRALRARQFPEDSGPLSHPVRPDSYIEINNFYTPTVYEKGAEVIRMMHTLLGAEGFRRGMDLYFGRHDGEAVTCEDFVRSMEDANEADLGQFRLWYSQAGTPRLKASGHHDPAEGVYELTVEQSCPPTPGQPDKLPLHIPLEVGLLDRSGQDLPLRLDGENVIEGTPTRVLDLRDPRQTFRFVGVEQPPVPSLLRRFSAPLRLELDLSAEDRLHLIACDSDAFNRWEAAQQYATTLLLRMVDALRENKAVEIDDRFIGALEQCLKRASEDRALAGELMTLPSENYLGQNMPVITVEEIHAAREMLRSAIAERLRDDLLAAYAGAAYAGPYSPDAEHAGRRRLRNVVLWYLCAAPDSAMRDLCIRQARESDNMTDRMEALAVSNDIDDPARNEMLADFYERWKDDPLVIDKWFTLQATSSLPGTLDAVIGLLDHPAFSLRVPNRVRALVGAFCSGNQLRFHGADGRGYRFLADRVLELDCINPQVAARLLGAFGQWRRFDPQRQSLIRSELERIAAASGLSRDVYEIATKTLG